MANFNIQTARNFKKVAAAAALKSSIFSALNFIAWVLAIGSTALYFYGYLAKVVILLHLGPLVLGISALYLFIFSFLRIFYTPIIYVSSDNIAESLGEDSISVINEAVKVSRENKFTEIEPILLLAALEKNIEGKYMLLRAGFGLTQDLSGMIAEAVLKVPRSEAPVEIKFGADSLTVLESARQNALDNQRGSVNVGDILLGLIQKSDVFKRLMFEIKIEEADIKRIVEWHELLERYSARQGRPFWEKESLGGIGRDWSFGYTRMLNQFARNLNQEIEFAGETHVYGRNREMDEIERILAKTGSNNALLIGDQGIGKKTIVKGFVTRIVQGKVLPALRYMQVFQVDTGAILSGSGNANEIASRIKGLFNEAARAGNIILFFDSFHALVSRKEGVGEVNTSEIILPYLQGVVRVIGSTTLEEYHRDIESSPGVAAVFNKIEVKEPNEEETTQVLEEMIPFIEHRDGVFWPYQSLKEVVRVAARYIQNVPFPQKAIEIVDEVSVEAAKFGKKIITTKEIDDLVGRKLEVPVTQAGGEEAKKLLNLEEFLHLRVIGQDEAITAVASAMRRARSGIQAKNRPIGTFLFLGPTGVGKCVVGDTLIPTNQGLIPIASLAGQKQFAPVATINAPFLSQISANPSAWFDEGVSDTIKVETDSGFQIEGTPEHPIVVFREDGQFEFKALGQAVKGDWAVLKYATNLFGKEKVDPDIAYLCGLVVGDGRISWNRRSVLLTTSDKEILSEFTKIYNNFYGKSLGHYPELDKYTYHAMNTSLVNQLFQIGVKAVTAEFKEIPEKILRSNKESVVAFLQGLYDTDGYMEDNGVMYSSASEKLCRQLQACLLNLGIVSSIRSGIKKYNGKKQYYVRIMSPFHKIFYEEIGFRLSRKNNQLTKLLEKKNNPNKVIYPNLKGLLRPVFVSLGGRKSNNALFWHKIENYIYGTRKPTQNMLEEFLLEAEKADPQIASMDEFLQLKKISSANFYFAPIAKITRGRSRVYDLTIPGHHNFIANGFISHNTETSKALAAAYFGSEKSMIRVDMSEFQEQSSIYRLIGSPPAAGAEGEKGQLTTAVSDKPFSLVLLDEIEKAHREIQTLFLQVFDEGRLTDGTGKTVNFTNTIIIATSNAGSELIRENLDKGIKGDEMKKSLLDYLQKQGIFRPEFLNRFDAVVAFHPLSEQQIVQVAQLMLKSLAERMAEKEITLKFTQDAVQKLAKIGFDPVYGARPMNRVIQDKVENTLATALLAGQIKRGSTVTIDEVDIK